MSGVTWVYILLGIYVVYCFSCGIEGYMTENTSDEFTVAGRSIPFVAFLLAATAASFSGWTFIGHPGLIWRDGLAYAFASFYVLTIPITGTFFGKRTWLMGKRYGFVTPGDMYAWYYNSEALRVLVVITAVLYALFYSAVQLMAAGALFHVITGMSAFKGSLIVAFIVWFYICTGGLKASTWAGVGQFILLVVGIMSLGYFVITSQYFGGWSGFSTAVAGLETKYLEVPRVINFGLGGAAGESAWTGVMILTYMFALMGIQSSPAFTMWTFGLKDPKPLAWQQVFMSTFIVGMALFFFTAFQGLGARLLQNMALAGNMDLAAFISVNNKTVVPLLMKNFLPPFMLGLVFVGAIAAIHSTAAPYIGTGGSIILRDIYWRMIKKQECSDAEEIWVNRIFVTLLTIGALLIGFKAKSALVILGALATAFGFVMYILLLGTLWGWKFPRIGAVLGVLSGMFAVFVTFKIWKNPLSMHCAFWGVFIGLVVAYICKGIGLKDDQETIDRQREIRDWLDSIDTPSESGKKWRKIMKIAVPVWYFFAVGPACILGNSAFKFAGFPSIWSWQIFWWMLGIVMMWGLAFKAEMATTDETQIARADAERHEVIHNLHQ